MEVHPYASVWLGRGTGVGMGLDKSGRVEITIINSPCLALWLIKRVFQGGDYLYYEITHQDRIMQYFHQNIEGLF